MFTISTCCARKFVVTWPRSIQPLLRNWFEKIESERKTRLDEFRAKTADKESLWLVWRAGFQWGHALRAVDSADRQIA